MKILLLTFILPVCLAAGCAKSRPAGPSAPAAVVTAAAAENSGAADLLRRVSFDSLPKLEDGHYQAELSNALALVRARDDAPALEALAATSNEVLQAWAREQVKFDGDFARVMEWTALSGVQAGLTDHEREVFILLVEKRSRQVGRELSDLAEEKRIDLMREMAGLLRARERAEAELSKAVR